MNSLRVDLISGLGPGGPNLDAVDAEQTRLAGEGFASIDESGTTCCYAKQDKFWVQGAPNGEQWEVYTVLADSATFSTTQPEGTTCCGTETTAEPAPTATTCC